MWFAHLSTDAEKVAESACVHEGRRSRQSYQALTVSRSTVEQRERLASQAVTSNGMVETSLHDAVFAENVLATASARWHTSTQAQANTEHTASRATTRTIPGDCSLIQGREAVAASSS